MKNIGLIIVFVVVFVLAVSAGAQTADATLGSKTSASYRATAADTIHGTSSAEVNFLVDKDQEYKFLLQASADSLSADSTVYFITQGSVDGLLYYPIDTVTWSMTTANTTVLFRQTSAVLWKWLGLKMQGNDTGTQAALTDKVYLNIAY